MKWIHLADVHLGAEPEDNREIGKYRKEEIWDTFRSVLHVCEEEQIDLLLIAGDLFHRQPMLRELKNVDYLFRKLTKTKVVLIAGNHDYLDKASHYYDITFPDNVVFLTDSKADSVCFEDIRTRVYGLSYEQRMISEPRYDVIKPLDNSYINILLAHGNACTADKSIPISARKVLSAGFDYIALGHVHKPMSFGERMAYSGCMEPLERNETGERGYIKGEIIKDAEAVRTGALGRIISTFVPASVREYVRIEVCVTPEMSEAQIYELAARQIEREGLHQMFLVTFCGKRAEGVRLTAEGIRTEAFLAQVLDETVPYYDEELIYKENKGNLIGMFIKAMKEDDRQELAGKALAYGLEALLYQE